jgi:hypothetical protein
MICKCSLRCLLVLCSAALLVAVDVSAQSTINRKSMEQFLARADTLSPRQKALLSPGLQKFLHFAARQANSDGDSSPAADANATAVSSVPVAVRLLSTGPGGTVRVSNPGADFRVDAYTQNTTSSARCGNTIVTGFEDGEDVLRTSGSLDAYSVSTNGGINFTDVGSLNPGANSALAGDPVLACSSSSHFYYASLFEAAMNCPGVNCTILSTISVSISTNGGASWSNPIIAANRGGLSFLDKPWLAVDPSNPARLFLTYTEFNSNSSCGSRIFGTAIELVSSSNGGASWSAPLILHQACGNQESLGTGSNVVVSPNGQVNVAYELLPFEQPDPGDVNSIFFTRSLNHGRNFTTPLKVTDVVTEGGAQPFGGPRVLQGGFAINEFPQLAVDRSNTSSRGTIYIAWSDGKNRQKPDLVSASGVYAYSDIHIAKSSNSGVSFTFPPTVSPTPSTFTGPGRDQFFPGIAVDNDGEVAVCYYDRRNDPENMAIDRFCSVSSTQGESWLDQRVSSPSWLPLHCADLRAPILPPSGGTGITCTQIGQYDTLTTDFLLQNDGFFGAFQIQEDGNPNIVGKKF